MTTTSVPPSPQGQAMLVAMKEAMRKNLERKQRLGHYIVIWEDGKPVQVGEDAPDDAKHTGLRQ